MNANGLLYAGHSENFAMARDYFTLRGKTVYTVNADKCVKTGAGGEPAAQRTFP